MTVTAPSDRERAFYEALGAAVVHVWADLPEGIQKKLFEHAIIAGRHSERDESLREELARFLHNRHE